MSELANGVYAGATSEMVANLLTEFLDTTREDLSGLDKALQVGADLGPYRRFAFETKGAAHNFGQPLLALVSQRMEDYLSAIDSAGERNVTDLRRFLDTLDDCLVGRLDGEADPSLVVRELPARPAHFEVGAIEKRDVEVMLVMLHGTQTHFVEREMQECGYRVTIVTSTIAALEQAVRARPDMIIISAVMSGLSGIDLTVALTAMPETRNIPVALITSLEPDDEQLGFVPDRVPVIRKGRSFGDDLARALSYHFLL